jgi:glycerol-3-phosphate dehydrogenase
VLAGGVWLDELLALDDPELAPKMRPARGVNIVVPGDRLPAGAAIAMTAPADGRLVFAIPWHHRTLISTTDCPYKGDLAHPGFEMAEVDYLLEVADHHFPGAGLGRRDVVAAQAGLRPLIAEPGKGVENLSRRERLIHTPSGVLAVGGRQADHLSAHRREGCGCGDPGPGRARRGCPERERRDGTYPAESAH